MTTLENILAVYSRATDADIIAGRLWYRSAREIAQRMIPDDYCKAAGIIAAFSPQMSWKENISLAAECIRRKRFRGHTGDNVRKAKRIWRGEDPAAVLGGHKVRAFYQCIITGGETQEVCIDRHALAISLGRVATDDELRKFFGRITWKRELVKAYQTAAEHAGILPSELQAITWVAWRREKGITD